MSSEEILEKHCKGLFMQGDFKAVYNAMSEYAKLDAIAFAEWCYENAWYHNGEHWRKLHDTHYLYTTEQLYELYKSKT